MTRLFCLQQVKHVARIQLYVLIVAIALVLCFVPTTNADAATSVMMMPIATRKRRQNVEQVVVVTTASNNVCMTAQQLEDAIQARALLLTANGTTPAANTTNCPSTEESSEIVWDWRQLIKLVGAIFLLCCSALCSGLTLGLLGLDKVSLEIVSTSGSEQERIYAKRIIPIRKRGNLLLCTLLLGNVMVNAGFSILTADVLNGLLAFVISTAFITIFGEIVPQAVCSRHGLLIGAYTFWLVYIMMFLLFPLAFPISFILDRILGAEIGTIYSKNELKQLVHIHTQHSSKSGLQQHEAKILAGALDYANQIVKNIMTPIKDVFMLEMSEKLDVDTMTKIWERGHSRIPIYKDNVNNIQGLLFTKDLVLINPEEELPLSTVIAFYGREVLKVFQDTHLDELLKQFKTGKSHMAIVHEVVEPEHGGDPFYQTLGIVTLEDVLEEIIRDEIIDETDLTKQQQHEHGDDDELAFANEQDNEHALVKQTRKTAASMSRRGKKSRLTPQQVIAVASYILKTIPLLQLIPEEYLHKLLGTCAVIDLVPNSANTALDNRVAPTQVHSDKDYLYKKGQEADYFCLLLSGKVEVVSGADQFTSENGAWSWYGLRAITNPDFVADFDARVTKATSYVKLTRTELIHCIEKITTERQFKLPKSMQWMSSRFKGAVTITTTTNQQQQATSYPASPVVAPSTPAHLSVVVKGTKVGASSLHTPVSNTTSLIHTPSSEVASLPDSVITSPSKEEKQSLLKQSSSDDHVVVNMNE